MPMFNKQALESEAGKFGFRRDTFEKVVHLKRILEFINADEYLNDHLWHGGMNLLGKEDAWDNLMRINNPEVAAELLEIELANA